VFSDATLVDMCLKHPRTAEEFLTVSGVGQVKLERYGERFLEVLRATQPNAAAKENLPQLTEEAFLSEVEIDNSPLQISRVADSVNAVLLKYGKPTTSGLKLNNLMLDNGYLEHTDDGKLPTESGQELGITTVRRDSGRGEYTQCLFSAEAQRECVRLVLQSAVLAE